MAFFGFFRRRPPIYEVGELGDFIDEQSAYLIQRYIFDYTHARTGPLSKSMFGQPNFVRHFERSRWSAFPLGLAMVGEMVEGMLRPHAGEDKRLVLDSLIVLVLDVYDRHAIPPAIEADVWRAAREELALKLDQVGLHPPKRVIDIPEPYAERYFKMMPFDEELLTNDVPTTRSYLRLTLTHIRDELEKRMNAAEMVEKLRIV
jgi:hypothetical protein